MAETFETMSFQNNISETSRPLANFSPSIWGYHFLSCAASSKNGEVEIPKQSQHLKEEIKHLLLDSQDPLERMNLIDTIQRLGISYHFESEIEAILDDIHKDNTRCGDNNGECDALYSVALKFRLLRQQGYNISSGVFENFRDDKGEFKMSLIGDILGMLSLYEATHLSFHGEDILDQALEFTTFHLQSRLNDKKCDHKVKVVHALKWPLHKCMRRLAAWYYIEIYSREDSKNEMILEFAVLDFNILQVQHQEELRHLTEWWKKLELVPKFPYARDRVVETYFIILATHFEPQYRIGRIIASKLISIIAILDDTYDAYATIEELELITEAIKRWDTSLMHSLSESMKALVETIIHQLAEMELMMAGDGKSSLVQYVKQAVQSLSTSYMVEAKWRDEGYVPTYDEYNDNGFVSSASPLFKAAAFLGLGEFATKEVFDWVSNKNSKMVRASSLITRLMNDISSNKFEQERGPVVTAIECCMKQYGISKEEARKLLLKDIKNYWKDINEECFMPNVVPKPVLQIVLNYTRFFEVLYENMVDRYTHAELLKDYVALLLVDPILIEQQK